MEHALDGCYNLKVVSGSKRWILHSLKVGISCNWSTSCRLTKLISTELIFGIEEVLIMDLEGMNYKYPRSG